MRNFRKRRNFGVKAQELDIIFNKLYSHQPVTMGEYMLLHSSLSFISQKVFTQYNLDNLNLPSALHGEFIEDVATMSLVKTLNGFKPEKHTRFTTYFFNKARSYTRVQAGKLTRRLRLLTASSLDASIFDGNEEDTND